MKPHIEALLEAGRLSPLDAAFARAVGRRGGEQDPEVLLAAALASERVAAGHACLQLSDPAEEADDDLVYAWPEPAAWAERLGRSALVGRGGDGRPLVLSGGERLYLARYYGLEQRLARALRERAAPAPPAAALREALERQLPSAAPVGEQLALDFEGRAAAPPASPLRAVVEAALARRLCVVTGGPGSGKTSSVVQLLAVFAGAAGDGPPLRCRLLAPTGKAAARLTETLRAARESLPPEVADALPDEAATLHRALGLAPGRRRRPRRLDADLVVVDEASMVDLATATALVEALPETARLVLLGDRDQLASVEAGAVLGDLCAAAEAGGVLAPCVVTLAKSHRFAAGGRIAELASAVREGRGADAVALLREADGDALALHPPLPEGGALSEDFARCALEGYAPLGAAEGPAALDALGGFRVLCALRRGPHGAEALGRAIEALLERAGPRGRAHPVMVLRNDYELGLFNGDTGVALPDGRACFPGPAGEAPRSLSLERLPDHTRVYAMTVHKSQGSEFDEVAVVLPDRASPVLSRELLYTAVTRARSRVRVFAAPEQIEAAVTRRVRRASGLAAALGAGPPGEET